MRRSVLFLLFAFAVLLGPSSGHAYINQADGTVVPVSNRLQQCLDLSEGAALAVDALAEAATLPEAYRPVFDAVSGHYRVRFTDIGEGAGFANSFGWFWVGEDVTNPANLRTIFGCRTYPTCDCPCTTTRTRTIDFDTQPGFSPGRQIGFWLRTPERLDGSRENGAFPSGCEFNLGCDPAGLDVNDSCGGRNDPLNRIYFTSAALNDDGDYVHFLVYRSVHLTDTFYFGFEDLFRGGDNDYEDMLVRGSGLVPECDPRPEVCDGDDDDCDGLIDEGITTACSTACGAGTRRCTAGSFGACSARSPTSETCNGTDDDCDGSTDEGITRACSNTCGTGTEYCLSGTFGGCTARTPSLESCNNVDDDCDGRTDEGLSRACASDCGAGTQTCVAGAFGACSAPLPRVETCNADDDDCDGRVDEGLVRACGNLCGTGTEVCRAGAYSGCTAPAAGTEVCNNLDDDCDGTIDEGLTRACSTACGVGTATCVAGSFVGCNAPLPADEVCNNLDDDCDGVIDDGNPGGGDACVPLPGGGYETPADGGGGGDGGVVCRAGTVRCLMGELVCQGAAAGGNEVCNCLDDDCDGRIDEETSADPLCPGGACVASECACASPCDPGEFPCPPGRTCDESLGTEGVRGYCIAGRCAGVSCDEQSVCNPDDGTCQNLCTSVTCRTGTTCIRGSCVEDNCYGRGCPSGSICRMDATGSPSCMPDACATTSCGAGEFCRGGACIATCDIVCDVGSYCVDGACVEDPCGGSCTTTQSCVEGRCVEDACTGGCGRGRVCRAGSCIDDPCLGVSCPGALRCDDGECIDPSITPRAHAVRGLAAGGGGCLCAIVGAPEPSQTGAGLPLACLGLLALVGTARRRRRAQRHARDIEVPSPAVAPRRAVGVALAAGVSLLGQGCAVEPFCFSNCDEVRIDAGPDAGRPDASGVTTDGCVRSGDELCDDRDNDCDGRVDETTDLEGDPRNCGGCGRVCTLEHAFPGCTEGECAISRCEIGWVDLDGVPSNGCEYGCPPDGDELCDARDNDCDGRVDEGVDLTSEIAHCGSCETQCQFPNGAASCVSSVCTLSACNAGYIDADGDSANGCEYACAAGGTEMCNGVDDDCDRRIDEGFDTTSDARHCGACGRACTFPNAVGRCVASDCTFGPTDCLPGWFDVDGDPRTGCEYMCTPTGAADTCNRIDDDCDGRIDEADPMVGGSCGTATGACVAGVRACVRGALTCVGGIGAIAELCNGADDDCDGRTDESVAPSPIAGVGDRCGATDVGICSYGTVACTSGAYACSGEVRAGTETCNGLDDDCDGAIDDSLTTPSAASVPSCAEARGVCAGRRPSCRGAMGWGCDLPTNHQPTETRCDALDNDCDGATDEGCLRVTGTDTRLDLQNAQSATNSLLPVIVASGTNVQLVWTETFARADDLDARVYYAGSTNSGTAFGAATRLNTTNGDTFRPRVMFTASNVLWAWADFRGGTNYREIWTRRSTDAPGTTPHASEIRVNGTGATATTDAYGVQIARAGSTLFATYEAFTTARNRHIFLSRSSDAGATWTTPVQVSTGSTAGFIAAQPRIAASSDRVYVVWRDNRSGSLDVFLRAWNVTSAAFVAAEQRMDVGTAPGASSSFSADVAAEGTNVYVAWVDDRDRGSFDIWLNRSTNSGGTWLTNAVKLDNDTLDHDSIEPRVIAPDTGDVLVAWVDYRSGFPDPYVTRSTTAGASFSTPARVDTGTEPGAYGSYDLAIAGAGNLVAVAWSDDRSGLLDVYANYSLDQGATWQPQDYRLDSSTAGSSDSQTPTIAVSGARIHVAWVDHRRGASCPTGSAGSPCPNGDIYYRRIE